MDKTHIEIEIRNERIGLPEKPPVEGCGAVVEFAGIVRGEEHGKAISALEYQAYQPMAERQIERLIHELLGQFPCASVRVAHRIGTVPVGESAILLQVASRNRASAFSFASTFMDRLKQEVPIWKVDAVPVAPASSALPQ